MEKMKIVLAPDSFKGSISASSACDCIEKGLKSVNKNIEVVKVPIADGGEGTLITVVNKKDVIKVKTTAPDGRKIKSVYGFTGDVAVVEMASSAGLTLVKEEKRNAGRATTFGVGEQIKDGIDKGYRKFLLTVGGSGTNDGGTGMVCALGVKFINSDGKEFIPTGITLKDIEKIDLSGVDKRLYECEITLATDVKNPLLGENGATNVYARQKGATDDELKIMEEGMAHLSSLIKDITGKDYSSFEGVGAGGGIGLIPVALFGAKIRSGIDAVLDAVKFNDKLDGADFVITGEGKIDKQSLFGKAISGVSKRANAKGVPVYAFVGVIGDDKEELKKMGLEDIFAISDLAKDGKDSMKNADKYLYSTARNFAFNIKE